MCSLLVGILLISLIGTGFSETSRSSTITSTPMLGDVYTDGSIDAADVRLVQKYIDGEEELTEVQKFVADVNTDGEINQKDVTIIFLYSLGAISELPYYGEVPECGDGIDNDEDGLIDYPEDTSCEDTEDYENTQDNSYVKLKLMPERKVTEPGQWASYSLTITDQHKGLLCGMGINCRQPTYTYELILEAGDKIEAWFVQASTTGGGGTSDIGTNSPTKESATITGNSIQVQSRQISQKEVTSSTQVGYAGSGGGSETSSCSDYDFNCDGKTTIEDAEVISEIWMHGTVINITLVTKLGAECATLGKYIGNLWREGKTELPISEVTRIGKEIVSSCSEEKKDIEVITLGTRESKSLGILVRGNKQGSYDFSIKATGEDGTTTIKGQIIISGETTSVKVVEVIGISSESTSVAKTTTTKIDELISVKSSSSQAESGSISVEARDASFTWDIDSNNDVDAEKDGEIIQRYLFGFEGDAIIEGLIGENAKRTSSKEIKGYLDCLKEKELLDVDDNEVEDPLTDGYIIGRYMLGFIGEDILTKGALGQDAKRTSGEDIYNFINNADSKACQSTTGPASAVLPKDDLYFKPKKIRKERLFWIIPNPWGNNVLEMEVIEGEKVSKEVIEENTSETIRGYSVQVGSLKDKDNIEMSIGKANS